MAQRLYQDSVIELTRRLYGDEPERVLNFAGMTDAEAEERLAALDQAEAEETARTIRATLRSQGHLL